MIMMYEIYMAWMEMIYLVTITVLQDQMVTNCTRAFANLTVGNISFLSGLLMIGVAFLKEPLNQ